MLKHLRILIGLLCLFILSSGVSHACSCLFPGPVCSIQIGTSTIFRGTVLEIKLLPNIQTIKGADGTTQQLIGNGRFRVRFSVAETFSGQPQIEQVVYTNQQSSACGFAFQEGREYVVFSYANDGDLWTSHCTRTTLLEPGVDNEEIRWMRLRATAPSGSEILGTVLLPKDSQQRTVSATVHLSGPSERSVQTDPSGHYIATGLPAGEYNVSAAVPAGFAVSARSSKVTVEEKGCAEIDWLVTYEGQISGHVHDVDGRPVADLRMTLEPKGIQPPGYERKVFATTELDGTYRFDHLSPGQYVLYTQDAFALTGDTPVYYPHAATVDEAKTIDLGASTSVGGFDFTLGKLKPTMSVRVSILNPDGSPAKAGLMLFAFPNGSHGDEPTRTAMSDASGIATLPLQSGREYAISIALDSNHQNCGFVTKTFSETMADTIISITSPEKCER